MTGFRVLVVDDERLAREMVAALLRKDPEVSTVIECGDGTQARDAIARHHPHIVFLDVEMPQTDGIEVAGSLSVGDPVVVFITAFGQYATRAFDVRAIDYVLKPFSDRRFMEALERAKQRVRERLLSEIAARESSSVAEARLDDAIMESATSTGYLERLSFKEGDRSVVLETADIVWIEAQDYYVLVHSKQLRHLLRATLSSLEQRLDPGSFLRVHRVAIVNLDEVRDVRSRNGMRLTLSDGAKVSVSRARRRRVEAVLGSRLRSKKRGSGPES